MKVHKHTVYDHSPMKENIHNGDNHSFITSNKQTEAEYSLMKGNTDIREDVDHSLMKDNIHNEDNHSLMTGNKQTEAEYSFMKGNTYIREDHSLMKGTKTFRRTIHS